MKIRTMMVQILWQRVVVLASVLLAGLGAVLPASTLAAVPAGLIQRSSSEGDARFGEAREAYRRNETVKLTRLAAQLEGHPLKPWVDYWLLRLRLDADDSSGVAEFLQRESGSYLADRLRAEYLRSLAKAGDWPRFSLESAALVEWDRELRCYAAQANGNAESVKALFLDGRELPVACKAPLSQLGATDPLSNEQVWQRVRRLHERKQTSEALRTLEWLVDGTPSAAQRKTFSVAQGEIMKSPARYLSRLPAGWWRPTAHRPSRWSRLRRNGRARCKASVGCAISGSPIRQSRVRTPALSSTIG